MMSSRSLPSYALLFTTSALSGEMTTIQSLRVSAIFVIKCVARVDLPPHQEPVKHQHLRLT